MRYILLGIGTLLSVLFIVQLSKGKQFDSLVENLESDKYPLCSLYTVGFSWGTTKLFAFSGKRAAELKNQAFMLYGTQYAEYYANVVWAQMLTLIHLFLTVTFLLSGFMYDSKVLLLGGGLFLTLVIGVYCKDNMKNLVSERTEECENQLPEVVSTMAVLVNSGMMLREAWTMISENGVGEFHKLMRTVTENMNNGYSEMDAIFLFGKLTNSTEIKKFTSALLQNMEKGGGELGIFLAQQSSELWSTKRQKMLQSGERAATKLLLPIVLIFVGIIIIVITAAFAGSLF